MPATTTKLTTVEEFVQLPDPPQGTLELHHGEVIQVPPVKRRHTRLQKRLEILLQAVATSSAIPFVEFPFRTSSDYEFWVADVALVNIEAWESAEDADLDYFPNAPELVVEVLSPPQDATDLFDKEQTCFKYGCQAFWIVDPKNRQIRVSTPAATMTTYSIGESVPVLGFAGSIDVAAVFVK